MSGHSFNYDFILGKAIELTKSTYPKVLDFGCGRGALIELAIEKQLKLDVWGADEFGEFYDSWGGEVSKVVEGRIIAIKEGVVQVSDNTFDAVISNQVFEHIKELDVPVKEIYRVLKPGGVLICIFPDMETWYEGHVRLYFAHWFNSTPRLQRVYLHLCRLLGFGRAGLSTDNNANWVRVAQDALHNQCFFHSKESVNKILLRYFKVQPESIEAEFMRAHFRNKKLPSFLRFILESRLSTPLVITLNRVRGNYVFAIVKS